MSSHATESNGLWKIPLGLSHHGFDHVLMKRRFDGLPNWSVVIVDAKKLLHFHNNDRGFVIRPISEWSQGKADGIRQFLYPSAAVEMPIASISIRRTRRFWGAIKDKETPVVSFINGRHRSRYLYEAGADHFPVEVENHLVEQMRQYCGA